MAVALKGDRPRIGVDVHVLEGIRQGSQTFCLELFSRVAERLPEYDFVFFVDTSRWHPAQAARFRGDNVTVVDMPHASAVQRLLVQLPRLTRRWQIDLLHTQYICPLFLSAKRAVTIHDILFEEYPQYFARGMRMRSKLLFRASAKAADLVFTGSNYSKERLVALYGLPPDSVRMIYYAANREKFFPGEAQVELIAALGVRAGEFILSVGRLEPRKNHAGLLQAYAQLSPPRPKLVIVGQRDFGYGEVFALVEALDLRDDVVFCESADDELLGALYRSAKLFVYPTFAEGFGLPVVEALASGVPVITANRTSVPEVAGDACLLVDPDSVEAIRAAMARVLGDPSLAASLRTKGLEQNQRFNWDLSADALAASYRAYLGR